MEPVFTESDRREARTLARRLDRWPRLRMTSWFGRLALNLGLRIAELYPDKSARDPRIRREGREVEALGRQVDVRIFRPRGECKGVVVEVHGGGFTIGNARMSDADNASLAADAGFAVVAVDYRLAVHHPLHASIDDCEAVLCWAIANGRAEFGHDALLLLGKSAGSHLAASALLRLRDRHGLADRVAGALLYFGIYDLAGTAMVRAAGPDTLILHGPTIRHVLRDLTPGLTDEQRRTPEWSPLGADLSALPPALFVVGALDPLLEDNMLMARRWREASGNARLIVAPDSPHDFIRFETGIARKVRDCSRGWLTARARFSSSG